MATRSHRADAEPAPFDAPGRRGRRVDSPVLGEPPSRPGRHGVELGPAARPAGIPCPEMDRSYHRVGEYRPTPRRAAVVSKVHGRTACRRSGVAWRIWARARRAAVPAKPSDPGRMPGPWRVTAKCLETLFRVGRIRTCLVSCGERKGSCQSHSAGRRFAFSLPTVTAQTVHFRAPLPGQAGPSRSFASVREAAMTPHSSGNE